MRIAGLLLVLVACRFSVPDVADGPSCTSEHTCPLGEFCDTNDRCEHVNCAAISDSSAAAGEHHTCAIKTDATTWCWGRNDAGQLGDGSTVDQAEPVQVVVDIATTFTAISAGGKHSCAIDQDRGVWCWGSNSDGQLGVDLTSTDVRVGRGPPRPGRGQLGDGLVSPRPVRVKELNGVTAIATGEAHSCALLENKEMFCWGRAQQGQLGTGQTEMAYSITPRQVGISVVEKIAAGGNTTCAIHDKDLLSCWGDNAEGQVGDVTMTPHPMPVVVPGKYRHVALGQAFMCAVTTDGNVLCAGSNSNGQLGDTGVSGRVVMVELPEVKAEAISAGGRFACATEVLDDRRRLWCWGDDASQQLADQPPRDHANPLLTAYDNVQVVVAGGAHLCAVSVAGDLTCSGSNQHGQLGDGHRSTQPKPPRPIAELAGVESVAAGDAHSCAVVKDGVVMCWGANDRGQLGDGTTVDRTTPVQVKVIYNLHAVVAGDAHTCALRGDTAMCWGANDHGQLGTASGGESDLRSLPQVVMDGDAPLSNIDVLAAGGDYTCALLKDRTVKCWGKNGESDTGPVTMRTIDMAVDGVPQTAAYDIAIGRGHSCAVVSVVGYVECWGANDHGQLGENTRMSRSRPMNTVIGPRGFGGLMETRHVSTHGEFACAVANSDPAGVLCWGRGDRGQIGNGNVISMQFSQPVTGLVETDWKVVAGGEHACAFRGSELRCWGSNEHGQVGDGGDSDATTPASITLRNGPVTALAAGTRHTCALLGDKTVSCWGDGARGQLGDGTVGSAVRVTSRLHCR